MDIVPTPPPKVTEPRPVSYQAPCTPYVEPEPMFSTKFIIVAVLVIGAAVVAGVFESGKLNLQQFMPSKGAVLQTLPVTVQLAAVPLPKPGTFTVTAISLGQTGFAIINGKSRLVGDALEVPGVTGWKVKQILDGAVLIQNGPTVASLPLTLPGMKPLNDQLHPLN